MAVAITALASDLLDAFIDGVEPLFARFSAKKRLVVVEGERGFLVYWAEGGTVTPLGALGSDMEPLPKRAAAAAVELRLAPHRLISQTLALPAAGRAYIDAIIEHRLDRLTPWRPDKVLHGFAVPCEASPEGTLQVRFAATSDDIASAAIEHLAAFGLTPTALGSAADPIDEPLSIDLYKGQRNAPRLHLRRRIGVLATASLILFVTSAVLSAALSAIAAGRLEDVETKLRDSRDAVTAASGGGQSAGRDRDLIAAKTPGSAVVVLVNGLAGAIPDGTYLESLSLDGGTVRIAGLSSDAPALIGLLEAGGRLTEVRFAAPVTRTDDDQDRFDITGRWTGIAGPTESGQASP
jgi:general secretion pathway protein L